MAEFERGDIVVYCYAKAPEWHGTLGIVDKYEPKFYPNPSGSGDPECYPVYILEFWSCAPGFPYTNRDDGQPWLAAAWEKVGHIELPPAVPHE